MQFCGGHESASLSWCDTPPGELDLCDVTGKEDPRGIALCNAHNEVTAINLGGLGLSGGVLPTELGLVTTLTSIELSNNQLLGALPTELGMLELLTELTATNAGIQGNLPTQLGTMHELREVHLAGNSLSGTVPFDTMGGRELRYLSLSDQTGPGISGTLPLAYAEVAGTSDRGQWYASRPATRRLHGAGPSHHAPHELAGGIKTKHFPAIDVIELRGARLSGTLPTQMGDLSGLKVLDLQDARRIQGNIPTELGRLKKLQYLYLGGTRIGGAPTHIPIQLDFPYMPGKRLFCFPMRLDGVLDGIGEAFRKPSAYNPLPTFETWEQQCF